MKPYFDAFMTGFIKGAKETPRGYFAPAIALWRAIKFVVARVNDIATGRA